MATKTLVSLDEYLATSYEPDVEYVHGELVERIYGTKDHSKTSLHLMTAFEAFEKRLGWFAIYGVQCQLSGDLIRIPDVAVWETEPDAQVPDTAPLIAIEVLSPEDRMSRVREECEEYRKWGVAHIWIADPQSKVIYVYDGGFRQVEEFSIPEFNVSISASQIFV